MLINCTNHPYEIWSKLQREAADVYGSVVDLPFPLIEPLMNQEELRRLVKEYSDIIERQTPNAVLVAGEFTFSFMLVDKLLSDGIKVLCTCSKRITTEVKRADGTNEKNAVFMFEGFREYGYYEKRDNGR